MTNTKQYTNAALEFTGAFNQKRYRFVSDVPAKIIDLRVALIEEEEAEYTSALAAQDKLEALDGLCDLTYVVAGTMVVCGISAAPFSAAANLYHPPTISTLIDTFISELQLAIPCHKRATKYANDLLQALDRIGYPTLPQAYHVVHANNMAKLWSFPPTDPTLLTTRYKDRFLVKNAQGKVIKPPNHKRPDLSQFLLT